MENQAGEGHTVAMDTEVGNRCVDCDNKSMVCPYTFSQRD